MPPRTTPLSSRVLHLSLASIFHDFNPIVFRISGDWAVRWYGLSYISGFIIAWAIMFYLATKGKLSIPAHRVTDALMWLIFATLAGGRVGYCIFYEPYLLSSVTSDFPFWGVLAINRGGMASHFAMVGCVLAALRISRGWKELTPTGETVIVGRCSLLHVLDALAITAPFGLLLGRFANFVNGELLGKIVTPAGTAGPSWAVQFPQELLGWRGPLTQGFTPKDVLPPQAGDVLFRLAASHTPPLSPQQQMDLNKLVASGMQVLGPQVTWTDALRWIIERPGAYRDQLIPLLSSRHPSQLYQAAAEGLILGAVAWICWFLFRPRPGITSAVWLMVYGALRIATEFWRLPDAQFGDAGRIIGLSRGQWFSVGMVVAGAALLGWVITKSQGKASPNPR